MESLVIKRYFEKDLTEREKVVPDGLSNPSFNIEGCELGWYNVHYN